MPISSKIETDNWTITHAAYLVQHVVNLLDVPSDVLVLLILGANTFGQIGLEGLNERDSFAPQIRQVAHRVGFMAACYIKLDGTNPTLNDEVAGLLHWPMLFCLAVRGGCIDLVVQYVHLMT